jgi:hypothetical protein
VKNIAIFQSGLIVWVTYPSEKCKDFSKWSHCNGRLAQVKNKKIFKVVFLYWAACLGEKYKDFLKWSHCYG